MSKPDFCQERTAKSRCRSSIRAGPEPSGPSVGSSRNRSMNSPEGHARASQSSKIAKDVLHDVSAPILDRIAVSGDLVGHLAVRGRSLETDPTRLHARKKDQDLVLQGLQPASPIAIRLCSIEPIGLPSLSPRAANSLRMGSRRLDDLPSKTGDIRYFSSSRRCRLERNADTRTRYER